MAGTPLPDSPKREPAPDPHQTGFDFGTLAPVPDDRWNSGMTRPLGVDSPAMGTDIRAWTETFDPLQFSGESDPSGRYRIGKEIGRGGVGVVFEGRDTQLLREIALKVLLPEHAGKAEVERRFLEEARIAGRLQHPGIIAIHGLGTTCDGRPYFAMRLVRGETLDVILKRRATASADLAHLLNIFLQVCQAVAYAHSEGIVHRDLKPANIMVGAFGVVKVMDWGLAKVLGEPDSAALLGDFDPMLIGTQMGTVFGTPGYLPPEQARGEIDRIDKRADVFGLGSILCEILTGEPPHTGGDGLEVYKKAAAGDMAETLARLGQCRAPLDVVALANWCLAANRDDRPANAGHVVEVLTAHLHSALRRAQQDLELFFDLSREMFCIAGTDGYFHRVNANFPRVLGHSETALTSQPFIDFVHLDDRADTLRVLEKLAEGERCVRFQNRYRHADGHHLWIEWNAESAPELRAVYAVARDVTELVAQAEAHRRDELVRLHLEAVAESEGMAIVGATLDGVVRIWNAGAERLFGYCAEEIVGRCVTSLVIAERADEAAALLSRVKGCAAVERYETIRRRKDGAAVPVALTLAPVRDATGAIIGVSKIVRRRETMG